MRKIGLLLVLLAPLQPLLAQSGMNVIPNPGFENWVNLGGYEDVTDWSTLNGMFPPDSVPVTKTTDAHSGNYAIAITVSESGSFLIPGQVLTYAPVSTKPYAMSGYYKYFPTGTDSFTVAIVMTKYNAATADNDIIGAGMVSAGGAGTYTPFTAVINYQRPEMPDSMRIYLVPGSGRFAGSELLVDDLSLQLTSLSAADAEAEPKGLQLYPNPCRQEVTLLLPQPFAPGAFTVSVTDVLGRTVWRQTGAAVGAEDQRLRLRLPELRPGLYHLLYRHGQASITEKLVVE